MYTFEDTLLTLSVLPKKLTLLGTFCTDRTASLLYLVI
jgi:hypothetical protein